MNRLAHIRITISLLLVIAVTSAFAGRAAYQLHERHSTVLIDKHVCWNSGGSVGRYQLGIHGGVLINDHVGFRLHGYGDWNFEGGGSRLEILYKPAIRWRFAPYFVTGGGIHVQKLDTTFSGVAFQEHVAMATVHVGLGGEVRFGSHDQNGIAVEFAGFYGKSSSKLFTTDTSGVEETHRLAPYQVEPYMAKLMYTYYFCTPIDVEGARDGDADGIKNSEDACPREAEDRDGFNDNDGCPDYDNDGDNIPDSLDQCDGELEDYDGFQDGDGCPEYDNDSDGVADSLDRCPELSEDIDTYNDEDGCPEADNDHDGFLDADDKCPNQAEDPDGFNDNDGCPEHDNDSDGVADYFDKCPTEKENHNNYEDLDGCPDERPLAVELEMPKVQAVEIIRDGLVLQGVTFESGRADLTQGSFMNLDSVISSLVAWPEVKIEVQGHTDRIGSARKNQELSQRRAESVKRYFTSKGISEKRVTAVGYGEEEPIADNLTAAGRAKNRRVSLKRIDK